MTVLGFENTSAAMLTTSVTTPAECQTTNYVAGANETAIVSIDVTTLTSANDTLWLAPMFTVNGGVPRYGVSFLAAGTLSSFSYATLHNQAMIQLTSGATYRFVTGVRTGSSIVPNEFTCRGLVTVVRRP